MVTIFQFYEDHQEIGKVCGSTVPVDSTTESYVLNVDFQSYQVLSGFKAIYYEAESKYADYVCFRLIHVHQE